jgi:hypothetical protein
MQFILQIIFKHIGATVAPSIDNKVIIWQQWQKQELTQV